MSRLQPRTKSSASTNINLPPAHATRTLDQKSVQASVHNARTNSADATSDRATLVLIRRTLCSQLGDKGRSTPAPIDEVLPPLTSSNDVDLQLYALIAIIIREFVQTWYTKITPDQVFVEEVVKIIAHCTRALEQRLRNVDLESLVFDELPELLDVHVQAYRTSKQSLHPSPFQQEPRDVYHSLWPFPALSPIPNTEAHAKQQAENEATYRQLLIQGVLVVLLPTEDLENDCLTALVGQILSEMIMGGGIAGKACEPWLLWEGITKIAEVIQTHLPKTKAETRLKRSNSNLVTSPSLDLNGKRPPAWNVGLHLQKIFWLCLQYGFVAFTTIRLVLITFASAPSLPSRVAIPNKPTVTVLSQHHTDEMDDLLSKDDAPYHKQPIMTMKVWSCVSSLMGLDFRMPWLSGIMSMLQWVAVTGPGEVGNTNGLLDKILSHAIHTHILQASHLPTLLRTIRGAIFPSNTLAPPRLIPSPAEALLIRRRCAETLLSLVPLRVRNVYYGTGTGLIGAGMDEGGRERMISEVEEVLNVFEDTYCNKHLMYGIVELILVRLIPELGEKGIEELRSERLG